MGAGNNKKTDQSRLWHQHLMKVTVYFEQNIQSNIYCDQGDSLQKNLANAIILLVVMVDQERK